MRREWRHMPRALRCLAGVHATSRHAVCCALVWPLPSSQTKPSEVWNRHVGLLRIHTKASMASMQACMSKLARYEHFGFGEEPISGTAPAAICPACHSAQLASPWAYVSRRPSHCAGRGLRPPPSAMNSAPDALCVACLHAHALMHVSRKAPQAYCAA